MAVGLRWCRALSVDQGATGGAAAGTHRSRSLRILGDGSGGRGGRPPTTPTGRPACGWTTAPTCSTTILSRSVPGSGVIGHLARGGHVPHRLPRVMRPSRQRRSSRRRGRRWALPGDMATVEADGTITVLGRGSLCINTRGGEGLPRRGGGGVEGPPGCPRCHRGRAARRPVRRTNGRPRAARPQRKLEADLRTEHARERLSGYKVPREIFLVEEIGRLPSGKPDYRWAKEIALRPRRWQSESHESRSDDRRLGRGGSKVCATPPSQLRRRVGGGCGLWRHHGGQKVVDLWGGVADTRTGRRWDEDSWYWSTRPPRG